MGMNTVRYGCTSLAGTNKSGPDENGYYQLIVGALNMFNSAGEFYDYERAKQLFDGSSHLMRRVERGVLKGEYGHPKMQMGMRMDQFAQRVLTIDEGNVCAHFRSLWLDPNAVKDSNGRGVVAIMADVRPSGPKGAYLKESLDNKDENVCFSIRAFTDDKMEQGVKKRVLKTVVTFDHVVEPGMAVAEKYKSPALESFEDTLISRGSFDRVMDMAKMDSLAMESSGETAAALFNAMGWNIPKNVVPVYAKW
jgi:hypothetical protein